MRENSNKKILVTDDAMFMRAMLKGILIQQHYTVYEAKNGQEALDIYEDIHPDIVFMDITMPVMDGITATKAIRSKHPDAIVIMCTALGQQTMVIEAVQAGAKDFIVKPFQAERVLECVAKHAA
jgi:two-component system chemotaxis response regulator CheY